MAHGKIKQGMSGHLASLASRKMPQTPGDIMKLHELWYLPAAWGKQKMSFIN